MIDAATGLIALLPQTTERVNFSLEPGVVLFAILFFVLVNLLLAAVLYPYLKNTSPADEEEAEPIPVEEEPVEEVPTDDEPLEERVDDFLEDIQKE